VALLRAEARTLALLREAVRDAAARTHRPGLASVRAATKAIERAAESALLEGTARARVLAGGAPGVLRALPAVDDVAAHLAASSLATSWGAEAMRMALDEEARTIDIDARLRRTAATETARAFNDERERLAGPGTFKIWNAVLDRATCPACWEKDGQIIPSELRFDRTPPLHPHCRCIVEIVPIPKPQRLDDIAFDYELFKTELRDVIREKREESERHAAAFVQGSQGDRRSPQELTKRYRRSA
jgi:hypothetical protein